MRRLAFRRLLPIAFLALYVALAALDDAQVDLIRAEFELENGYWDEKYFEFDTPLFADLNLAINGGAVLFAIPILGVVSAFLPATYSQHIAWGGGVVLFWYFAGRWLDQRCGFLPLRWPRLSRGIYVLLHSSAFVWAVLLFALNLFMALVFVVLLQSGFMRFSLPAWTLWCGAVAVVQAQAVRHWTSAQAVATSPGS